MSNKEDSPNVSLYDRTICADTAESLTSFVQTSISSLRQTLSKHDSKMDPVLKELLNSFSNDATKFIRAINKFCHRHQNNEPCISCYNFSRKTNTSACLSCKSDNAFLKEHKPVVQASKSMLNIFESSCHVMKMAELVRKHIYGIIKENPNKPAGDNISECEVQAINLSKSSQICSSKNKSEKIANYSKLPVAKKKSRVEKSEEKLASLNRNTSLPSIEEEIQLEETPENLATVTDQNMEVRMVQMVDTSEEKKELCKLLKSSKTQEQNLRLGEAKVQFTSKQDSVNITSDQFSNRLRNCTQKEEKCTQVEECTVFKKGGTKAVNKCTYTDKDVSSTAVQKDKGSFPSILQKLVNGIDKNFKPQLENLQQNHSTKENIQLDEDTKGKSFTEKIQSVLTSKQFDSGNFKIFEASGVWLECTTKEDYNTIIGCTQEENSFAATKQECKTDIRLSGGLDRIEDLVKTEENRYSEEMARLDRSTGGISANRTKKIQLETTGTPSDLTNFKFVKFSNPDENCTKEEFFTLIDGYPQVDKYKKTILPLSNLENIVKALPDRPSEILMSERPRTSLPNTKKDYDIENMQSETTSTEFNPVSFKCVAASGLWLHGPVEKKDSSSNTSDRSPLQKEEYKTVFQLSNDDFKKTVDYLQVSGNISLDSKKEDGTDKIKKTANYSFFKSYNNLDYLECSAEDCCRATDGQKEVSECTIFTEGICLCKNNVGESRTSISLLEQSKNKEGSMASSKTLPLEESRHGTENTPSESAFSKIWRRCAIKDDCKTQENDAHVEGCTIFVKGVCSCRAPAKKREYEELNKSKVNLQDGDKKQQQIINEQIGSAHFKVFLASKEDVEKNRLAKEPEIKEESEESGASLSDTTNASNRDAIDVEMKKSEKFLFSKEVINAASDTKEIQELGDKMAQSEATGESQSETEDNLKQNLAKTDDHLKISKDNHLYEESKKVASDIKEIERLLSEQLRKSDENKRKSEEIVGSLTSTKVESLAKKESELTKETSDNKVIQTLSESLKEISDTKDQNKKERSFTIEVIESDYQTEKSSKSSFSLENTHQLFEDLNEADINKEAPHDTDSLNVLLPSAENLFAVNSQELDVEGNRTYSSSHSVLLEYLDDIDEILGKDENLSESHVVIEILIPEETEDTSSDNERKIPDIINIQLATPASDTDQKHRPEHQVDKQENRIYSFDAINDKDSLFSALKDSQPASEYRNSSILVNELIKYKHTSDHKITTEKKDEVYDVDDEIEVTNIYLPERRHYTKRKFRKSTPKKAADGLKDNEIAHDTESVQLEANYRKVGGRLQPTSTPILPGPCKCNRYLSEEWLPTNSPVCCRPLLSFLDNICCFRIPKFLRNITWRKDRQYSSYYLPLSN